MSETIEEIILQLNKLKEPGVATHLETTDILWDIPNQFVNSIETLLIILTKTSSIPLIPTGIIAAALALAGTATREISKSSTCTSHCSIQLYRESEA
jgi:spore maturation protein SpmA